MQRILCVHILHTYYNELFFLQMIKSLEVLVSDCSRGVIVIVIVW
jgi:hypothetical protein